MKKALLNINFKQLLVCIAVIYATENTFAQKERKNHISLNYSFGFDSYNRNGSTVGGFGAANMYRGADFKSIAIEYAHKVAPSVEFCTGLTATAVFLVMTSKYGGSYRESMGIFSLPLHLRRYFSKYLFLEGGVDLNYNPYMGYKYGGGLSASLGVEHVFDSGITLVASPLVRWNILGGMGENDMGNADTYVMTGFDTLFQLGIKLGVGYRF
ncbi:MAG: hypothetical protein LBG80_10395 [Bacteroidales bacterium]|jgi:hypothetical protein|nr:hypothetical protein [Bacteroidales bacterium]